MKRCFEIYFEFFVGLSFTVAVALLCESLVFVTKRKMNKTNRWIHAFINQWMYSMYTERQGRKIADWLPFSRQSVLSADHFTTNQVVYMHDLSGIFFFQPISGFSALPTLKWIRSIRRDKKMTWTNTLSVTCKWIDGRKHVQMNGCSI